MKIGRFCIKNGCDLKLVNKHEYVAFNGHKRIMSDYVCKRCGRKDTEVTDFNTGICVFDEKRQEIEKKMKEAVKSYEEDCKKLMKEVSEVIKKRWKKTKDKNQRHFDYLEAEAFKYVCKIKSQPLQNLLKEKV